MNTIKKIFYINLDRCIERNSSISKHLSKFDIPFERFKAIDGKELSDSPIFNRFVKARHNTEIKLLNFIKNLDEGLYLINEDDILIEDKFFEKLDVLLKQVPDDWQILKIGSHTLYNSVTLKPVGPHIKGTKVSEHLFKLENGSEEKFPKNIGQQCYIIRHIGNNIDSIIENLEKHPLDHIDHNYNKIMDNINIYSTEINHFIFFEQLPFCTTIHVTN